MSMYNLGRTNNPDFFPSQDKKQKQTFWFGIILFIVMVMAFWAGGTYYSDFVAGLKKLDISLPGGDSFNGTTEKIIEKRTIYLPQTSQEEAIIKVVNDYSKAVVSIVISKDVPVVERYYISPFDDFEQFFNFGPEFQIPQYRQKGTEKKEIGGGSGFIISNDGLVLTNKHVVSDEEAEYTVFLSDGKKYQANVLAKDPVQDLAILKIAGTDFPAVKLGDSSSLQIGQTVIAIGNALGEFSNTVSVGVISGLERRITAGGSGMSEVLENVIQTDAAINQGNSGGPLLNLKGEVIGVNTAMAIGAQNIGFTIPIDLAKRDIEQVKKTGKIAYPFLGVNYVLLNESIREENNLSVDYGAWIISGDNGQNAVILGSPAAWAGLKEKDIILEFNNEQITASNSLAKIISKYAPGDEVKLKILRGDQQLMIELVLGEREEETL